MFALFATVPVAFVSPSPSPAPTPPPQIAHVVTSDRSTEALARATRVTYVVTAADIARNGYRTVADAIENVPGVNLERYGAFGAATSIGLRGTSSEQVLVLLDGLPIAGNQIDDLNLESLSTAGVDRIEIVEGGGSTLYGSGSIGGVINIITSRAPKTSAVVSAGSFGTQTYAFETPFLSFARTYATNDYPLSGGATQHNADAGLTTLRGGYSHAFGDFEASLSGDLSSLRNGDPGPASFLSATSRQSSYLHDIRFRLAHRGKASTLSLELGESANDLSYTCDTPVDPTCPNEPYPVPSPGAPAPPPFAQFLYDTRVMLNLNDVVARSRQRLVYGMDLSRGIARIDAGTGFGPPQLQAYAQSAAYLQQQWLVGEQGEVYAGLRGERDGAQGGALSPSLGGIVQLAPALLLKLNAATAFRAPTAEELYYPGFSNPSLQPERARVADATLDAPGLLGGASFGWFSTSATDLIAVNPVTFAPANVGRALIQGMTLTLKTRPVHGITSNVSVTNLFRAQNLVTGTRLDDRGPVFDVGLGLEYTPPAWSRFDGFGVEADSQGPRGIVDYAAPMYDQPAAFTRIDAYAGFRILPHAVLAIRGYNLGNERYSQFGTYTSGDLPFYEYPMPGRSFAVELRTR